MNKDIGLLRVPRLWGAFDTVVRNRCPRQLDELPSESFKRGEGERKRVRVSGVRDSLKYACREQGSEPLRRPQRSSRLCRLPITCFSKRPLLPGRSGLPDRRAFLWPAPPRPHPLHSRVFVFVSCWRLSQSPSSLSLTLTFRLTVLSISYYPWKFNRCPKLNLSTLMGDETSPPRSYPTYSVTRPPPLSTSHLSAPPHFPSALRLRGPSPLTS